MRLQGVVTPHTSRANIGRSALKTDRQSGLRILLAGSEEIILFGLRSVLESQRKWKICGEAASGKETIRKTRSLCPDLLLLDVTMPDLDPANSIIQIRLVCPTVKIIALACRNAGILAGKAVASGASGLALKSDSANDLILTVQSVAMGKAFLSPSSVAIIRGQLTSDSLLTDLTPREAEVLGQLAKGISNKEVATVLKISIKTVDVHRASIMRRLGLHTYNDLIHFAIRHGIIAL
jgi:DNA-binding NarL/FixJ family response regulator